MESARATEVLEAIRSGRGPAVTSEELTTLSQVGLVQSFDPATRDGLASRLQGLHGLAARVQDLSRAVHGWRNGTGVIRGADGSRSGPDTHVQLRAAMDEFEDLSRLRTLVESLVWNEGTQNFLALTLEGRRVLADLRNWSPRLGNLTLAQFRGLLEGYRTSLAQAVARSHRILVSLLQAGLLESSPEFTRADFRLASVALTGQPGDLHQVASEFGSIFRSAFWAGIRREDHLVGAVVLTSVPGDAGAAVRALAGLRDALIRAGVPPDDALIAGAALADLPGDTHEPAVSRLAHLRSRRSMVSSTILSGLARSPYPVDDALHRLDEAARGITRLGYADGDQGWAAASILAASRWPLEAAVDRFRQIAGRLPRAFYSPLVAGALLAATDLEPNESIEAIEECIGAVTRGSLFDLTVEIESLALILSYAVTPVELRATVTGVAPPMVPALPVVAATPISTWFIPHNLWVYRPVVRYIASHPAHVHAVPGFG